MSDRGSTIGSSAATPKPVLPPSNPSPAPVVPPVSNPVSKEFNLFLIYFKTCSAVK